jgi:hypothetical protein
MVKAFIPQSKTKVKRPLLRLVYLVKRSMPYQGASGWLYKTTQYASGLSGSMPLYASGWLYKTTQVLMVCLVKCSMPVTYLRYYKLYHLQAGNR